MFRVPATQVGRRRLLALAALVIAGLASVADAAERGFPYNTEMMLDARPMRGSKRVPMIEIKSSGKASIDLWCNSVKAQFEVDGDKINMVSGERTEEQCAPDRMKADDDLVAAFVAVTNWRRDGTVLTLLGGPKPLRFRSLTH